MTDATARTTHKRRAGGITRIVCCLRSDHKRIPESSKSAHSKKQPNKHKGTKYPKRHETTLNNITQTGLLKPCPGCDVDYPDGGPAFLVYGPLTSLARSSVQYSQLWALRKPDFHTLVWFLKVLLMITN